MRQTTDQDNLMASKVTYWPPLISYRSDRSVGQLVFGTNWAKRVNLGFIALLIPG